MTNRFSNGKIDSASRVILASPNTIYQAFASFTERQAVEVFLKIGTKIITTINLVTIFLNKCKGMFVAIKYLEGGF